MEFEAACHRLCDDIRQLLLSGPRAPAPRVAYAAGRATHDLAAAFHRAAGRPEDQLWSDAIESIGHFLDVCDKTVVARRAEVRELRSFVAENADALPRRFELRLAS